jgi:hypothetical protein
MTKDDVIARLRAREAELRAMGIERLSLFGSVARGEEGPASEVDLVAKLRDDMRIGMFAFVRMGARLADMLNIDVDLVTEPSDAARLQAQIDRDRAHVL